MKTTPPDASPADLSLGRVQRWMQAVIVHPGCVDHALASPGAQAEVPAARLGDLMKPSWSLPPAERVEIYHDMYLLRMGEALESDYPALRHHLGEDGFRDLVRDYVERHPSRSYTLNRLGDHLPRFLAGGPREPRRTDAAFLHDLARTELAITEAFDAEESPAITADQVQEVAAASWDSARLRPAAALRLLDLRYDVEPHLDAAKQGRRPPLPRRRRTWLAIFRRDYTVMRRPLSRPEHDLLCALASGVPLGQAMARVADTLRASEREQRIFRWFRSWIAQGFFHTVEG